LLGSSWRWDTTPRPVDRISCRRRFLSGLCHRRLRQTDECGCCQNAGKNAHEFHRRGCWIGQLPSLEAVCPRIFCNRMRRTSSTGSIVFAILSWYIESRDLDDYRQAACGSITKGSWHRRHWYGRALAQEPPQTACRSAIRGLAPALRDGPVIRATNSPIRPVNRRGLCHR
jgi:hypothetical protein